MIRRHYQNKPNEESKEEETVEQYNNRQEKQGKPSYGDSTIRMKEDDGRPVKQTNDGRGDYRAVPTEDPDQPTR